MGKAGLTSSALSLSSVVQPGRKAFGNKNVISDFGFKNGNFDRYQRRTELRAGSTTGTDDNTSTEGKKDSLSLLVAAIPAVVPFIAYFSYEGVAVNYQHLAEAAFSTSWEEAAGGASKIKTIIPILHSIVLPVVSYLFATLMSMTISSLYQRQTAVREALTTEAGEIRVLRDTIELFPEGPIRDESNDYLIRYTDRIIEECGPDLGGPDNIITCNRLMGSEMNLFLQFLHEQHDNIPSHIVSAAYSSIGILRSSRQSRIKALQSTYPPLHYAVLVLSSLVSCSGFLLEANQNLDELFAPAQLKLIWSVLTGTYVACFGVLNDLRSPFVGYYQISTSVNEIRILRQSLLDTTAK